MRFSSEGGKIIFDLRPPGGIGIFKCFLYIHLIAGKSHAIYIVEGKNICYITNPGATELASLKVPIH